MEWDERWRELVDSESGLFRGSTAKVEMNRWKDIPDPRILFCREFDPRRRLVHQTHDARRGTGCFFPRNAMRTMVRLVTFGLDACEDMEGAFLLLMRG